MLSHASNHLNFITLFQPLPPFMDIGILDIIEGKKNLIFDWRR